MTQSRNEANDGRRFLFGALTAIALTSGALIAFPCLALAQGAPAPATPSSVIPAATPAVAPAVTSDAYGEAVRRLMIGATNNALSRLAQPNGFLKSTVARFGMPVLFAKTATTQAGPLTNGAFRELLLQRLNLFAEAGARGAAPVVAEAARKLPIKDPAAILRGKPTAATSTLRFEMGAGLANALLAPIEQAMVAAQDPTVAQAIASLPGVTLRDVAQAVALSADNGIWYEVGASEADLRADPAAGGDAELASLLVTLRAPAVQPAPPLPTAPKAAPKPARKGK